MFCFDGVGLLQFSSGIGIVTTRDVVEKAFLTCSSELRGASVAMSIDGIVSNVNVSQGGEGEIAVVE